MKLLVGICVLGLAVVLSGCSGSSADDLVGTWTTQLVGYNQSASGATKYEQKVTFSEDGRVLLETTLAGGSDGQQGSYEVGKDADGQFVRIAWDASPDTPLELGFSIQGDKLSTTRREGSMPKPPNMNVTEQDPVVYVRKD